MCFSVGKSENAVTGNAACCVVNVSFYFILCQRQVLFTFHLQEERTGANEPSFSFQIQVSEARYTSVTQTLMKIGKEEGLYGYFKVMFLPFVLRC